MKYRILLKDKVDVDILKAIKSKHSGDVEGINELYDLLIENGSCDTYEASKIYYLAYTLALKDIEIIIVRVD
ncbi:MAG TPA: hypothetical protein VK087_06415 [Tissierellaceae bacterium]|nr:hypothetical protein [Tissierellaceae bacterium]